MCAPLPLALGIALDIYVATARALESSVFAGAVAGVTVLVLALVVCLSRLAPLASRPIVADRAAPLQQHHTIRFLVLDAHDERSLDCAAVTWVSFLRRPAPASPVRD